MACRIPPKLGETTSTSDLDTLKQTKLFQPVEQAYLKAFIKITRQKTKADHHHLVLNEALRIECPPRGLTPNIRHNIPKPPADLIIKWNQTLFNTAHQTYRTTKSILDQPKRRT